MNRSLFASLAVMLVATAGALAIVALIWIGETPVKAESDVEVVIAASSPVSVIGAPGSVTTRFGNVEDFTPKVHALDCASVAVGIVGGNSAINSDGSFTIGGIPTGPSYPLCFSAPGLADVEALITPISTSTDVSFSGPIELRSGDIDNDGVIDSTDLTILISQHGTSNVYHPTIPEFRVDMSGDSFINISDIAILGSGFGEGTMFRSKLSQDIDLSTSTSVQFDTAAIELPVIGDEGSVSITVSGALPVAVRGLQLSLVYPKNILEIVETTCPNTVPMIGLGIEDNVDSTVIGCIPFPSNTVPSGEVASFTVRRIAEGGATIEFGRLGLSENIHPSVGHRATKFSDIDGVTYETGYGGVISLPADDASINGSVTLQSIVDQSAFDSVGATATAVRLSNGSRTPGTFTGVDFSVPELFPGDYSLEATAPGFLMSVVEFDVSEGQSLTIPDIPLRAGLVDGDNVVSIRDISAIAASFGQIVVDRRDGLGRIVDMNADGVVDLLDISAVASNFGAVSPLP